VPEQERKIAVDGWVSNDPNMTYVKVYYPAAFQSGSFNRYTDRPEIRRMYVETETAGRNIEFEFSLALDSLVGSYLPVGDFELDVNERYRLNFILQDRTHYQSTWQEVAPAPKIKEYHYEAEEKLVFINPVFGEPFGQTQVFLNVNVELETQSENAYGYYFKTKGIEEVHTQFDPEEPRPLECQCTCYIYYDILSPKININPYYSNTELGSEGRFNVVALPMNRLGRFYVEIDMYGLNEFQTSYFGLIQAQQENTGNIFDAMPSNIKGNITNLSDEKEVVLGTFSTSNYKFDFRMVRRVNFYASQHGFRYRVEAIPILREGMNICVDYYTEGTMEKPEIFDQVIFED
ncbi:DUF4249 family protein, partial [Litoribacter ruber]|uniref:DUF4249 family protein n=1 Tax=Litoribacter ruber TaxID=702568 RepID=UPI001BDAFDF8